MNPLGDLKENEIQKDPLGDLSKGILEDTAVKIYKSFLLKLQNRKTKTLTVKFNWVLRINTPATVSNPFSNYDHYGNYAH